MFWHIDRAVSGFHFAEGGPGEDAHEPVYEENAASFSARECTYWIALLLGLHIVTPAHFVSLGEYLHLG